VPQPQAFGRLTEDDTSPFLEWRILCDKRSGGILIRWPSRLALQPAATWRT